METPMIIQGKKPPNLEEALQMVKAMADALEQQPGAKRGRFLRATVDVKGQRRNLYVEDPQFIYDAAVFAENGKPLVRIGRSRWHKGWNLNFDLYPNPPSILLI